MQLAPEKLYEALNYVDHSREKRMAMARMLLQSPALAGPVLDIACRFEDPVSSRACWILEFAAREDLRILDGHLDQLVRNLSKHRLESSVRPMAKICELLILEHYGKDENPGRSQLSDEHLEEIAAACFDWLIGPHKVAPKAYSMTSLYHLGKSHHWIHPELKMLLEKEYHRGSAAFKARARHILAKL